MHIIIEMHYLKSACYLPLHHLFYAGGHKKDKMPKLYNAIPLHKIELLGTFLDLLL
jgi:hypothetical protein